MEMRFRHNILIKFLFPVFLLLIACSHADLRQDAINEILHTDKEMSKKASEVGFNRTLMEYACDGFVKLNNGSFPVVGKLAFSERFLSRPDIKTISWAPEEAESSASGDLGYSWGNWKFVTPDTTYYGNYVTIWKKDTGGKWRMLLDGGNSTPKPKDE
jgi:ketosteroid isomerase-like protein